MLALWLAEHHEEVAEAANGAHEAAGHAAEHSAGVPELPNLFGTIHHLLGGLAPKFTDSLDHLVASCKFNDPMGTPFSAFENILYALIVIGFLSWFFISGYLRRRKSPKDGPLSRRALFSEIVVLFFDDFFGQILGRKEGRKHLSFVGTLFIYILCCNCFGLVFLGKAPTANLSFNLGMAVLVFFYVHFTGISRSPLGYLKHYPGTLPTVKELGMGPAGVLLIGFMAILFTIIHVLEAVIQPVSLSLRLFGNVLGKDVLLGVFGSLMVIHISTGIAVAFPWHTPFLFLGLLLGAIQALIFSLLSAVYITLWLPHDEHHAEEHA
ncbi:F0F1 ATP synthase subunit A [bacterium]|nr:F0F1 ATP synthase subunit A [bacterium]